MKKRLSFLIFSCLLLQSITFSVAKADFLSGDQSEIDSYSSSSSSLSIPSAASNLPNPSGGVKTILESLVKWALGIFGFLAIIGFVISGIMYITAAGDDDQAKSAKKNMYYSIIGVIIVLAGFIIIQAVEAALNASNSQF